MAQTALGVTETTGTERVIGVVTRTYDGEGNFKQCDNIKGTSSGIVPDRSSSGAYQVDADCTWQHCCTVQEHVVGVR
jgi:hypothetical protein